MLDLYNIMLEKEKHGEDKLIYIQFNKHDYIFRLLAPKEYAQCKLLTSNKYELNDAICQLTLIYPSKINFIEYPIGCLSDNIAQVIVDKSLIFKDAKVLKHLEDSRQHINKFVTQCALFVKAAFISEFSLDEIESWSYEKLVEMAAKAERILELRGSEQKLEYEIDESKSTAKQQKIDPKKLLKNGIDPMFYYSNEIILKKPLIDYPIILGPDWHNKELSDSVGRQILGR